jgi:two-component system, cell cycle sensor histidine kinase and response regulator CckA
MVETDRRPIHLALLDIMMPQMDGFELAERLKERRPGLKVLHMSGHTEGVTSRRVHSEAVRGDIVGG